MDRSNIKRVTIHPSELPANPNGYDIFRISTIKIIIIVFLYTVAISWGGFFRILAERLFNEKDTIRVALTYAICVTIVALIIIYKWNHHARMK